ncbi:MAG: aminodeoxychorismate/anthranilate synthase component II [Bacteroides sp.]|nr:aminodeoxychorismate/anthranilate synthase component II [Bacteroides sp.]
MKQILILDNYDSFTYNLYQLVNELGNNQIEVHRNDQIALEEIQRFDQIILSPGPGIPREAGLLLDIIKEYASTKSILGVCLGHQAIGEAFGATLTNLTEVYHGVQTPVKIIQEDRIFQGLGSEILAGRYHSWVINPESLPTELIVTAESREKQIMAIRHQKYDVHGIQFHPESILTPQGKTIIANFLKQ